MIDGFNGDFEGDKTAGTGIRTHDLLTWLFFITATSSLQALALSTPEIFVLTALLNVKHRFNNGGGWAWYSGSLDPGSYLTGSLVFFLFPMLKNKVIGITCGS